MVPPCVSHLHVESFNSVLLVGSLVMAPVLETVVVGSSEGVPESFNDAKEGGVTIGPKLDITVSRCKKTNENENCKIFEE